MKNTALKRGQNMDSPRPKSLLNTSKQRLAGKPDQSREFWFDVSGNGKHSKTPELGIFDPALSAGDDFSRPRRPVQANTWTVSRTVSVLTRSSTREGPEPRKRHTRGGRPDGELPKTTRRSSVRVRCEMEPAGPSPSALRPLESAEKAIDERDGRDRAPAAPTLPGSRRADGASVDSLAVAGRI